MLGSSFGALALPAGLVACQRGSSPIRTDADASRVVTPYGQPITKASDPVCPHAGTAANIEGPYYRAGAPFRSNLIEGGIAGAPLVITGRVLSLDCRSPLTDAVLDIWQADGDGHYDNDGTFGAAGAMRLRGKVRAAANGSFSVRSVLPGRYLNGRTYRPSHVHVKVTATGHLPLTTQLYFPDDPYNDGDPFIHRSLIMDVSRGPSGAMGHFDFVLTPS